MSAVYIKEYAAPPVDRGEILRYLRTRSVDEQLERELTAALSDALPALSYRLCYAEFALGREQGELDLGFARSASRDLAKNLAGCTHIVVFAATLGVGLDRLITRYSSLSPVRALCLQAIGAERIEALCDSFVTDFQPMGANFGILPELSHRPRDKAERGQAYADRSLEDLKRFIEENNL